VFAIASSSEGLAQEDLPNIALLTKHCTKFASLLFIEARTRKRAGFMKKVMGFHLDET